MDKLNEYLRALLSSCSDELHLEPNNIPYLVSSKGATEVASVPVLGTQIGMMIFPLIPGEIKRELPNKAEVEFVHPHDLGSFNFVVKKSPAGFMVTIRPMLAEASDRREASEPEAEDSVLIGGQAKFESNVPFLASPKRAVVATAITETPDGTFASAPIDYQIDFDAPLDVSIEPESNSDEVSIGPDQTLDAEAAEIELVPVNDPDFITTFSADAADEPIDRRDDFAPMGDEYAALLKDFSQPEDSQTPIEADFSTDDLPANAFAPMEEFSSAHSPAAAQVDSLMKSRMDALFEHMAQIGASDLHLSVSVPPMVRRDGKIQPLQRGEGPLSPEMVEGLLTSIMPAKNKEEYARRRDTDFAYEIAGLARFRANIFADRKGMGGVFRIIPAKMTTAEQLGLSPAILNLCDLSKGLVVVTGPTGSGKSTTLCAMINHINTRREDHIITIEDPIEFVHDNQQCLINQREVHNHTDSFKDALRAALREDPDILLVGEMRDLETISIAIETAETGHLVFGTLHTTTAASTVDRIIDQFPADRQQQIRVMLSESLKGVIAQTLLPKKGGGRVAALEVLIVTPAISNLIREGKTFQIPSSMQTGRQHGMVMLNDALFELVKKGTVEPRDAYLKAVDKAGFETQLTRAGFSIE